MSLLDVVRGAVAIADNVTKPLQATVSFRHYAGSDAYGAKTYVPDVAAPALALRAIIDWKQKQLRTQEGVLSVSRAMVMFLDVQALSTATSGQGVNDEDLIVLPDGTTGPILDMAGFIDPGTGHPIATEIYLG